MVSHKMAVETDTCVDCFEYEWKIKNFLKHDTEIRGKEFRPLKSLPVKFVLEYEPWQFRRTGYLGYNLNLIKLSEEEIPETSNVAVSVKVGNGHSITALPESIYLLAGKDSISIFEGSLGESTNNLYVLGACINANTEYLSFLCTFTFFGHDLTTVSNPDPDLQMSHERYSDIFSGLKSLYESKAYSYITFEIGESSLKAHRCILVAQSPVFKQMLENNLAESESNCIQITDFDVHVYDCLLKYLYCGEMEDTSIDVVMDLFALADKYSVESLAKYCRVILVKNLTIDNVCKVLVLSYLHRDGILKDKSMQFINQHFSLIKGKTEWIKLVDDYPTLASEYFKRYVN